MLVEPEGGSWAGKKGNHTDVLFITIIDKYASILFVVSYLWYRKYRV